LAAETKSSTALETFAREDRTFPPPKEFAAQATAKDPGIYQRAEKDLEGFWAEQAKTLAWRKPFTKVLEWEAPYAKWFLGGELNVSENCLDRHVKAGKGSKVAYYWEGEPSDARAITYQDLLDMTSRAANALKELGVKKGDRVAIYMPMIPELPAAMLACARIGAPFTVVFGGFSAEALSGRINDAEAKVLITADGGYRKGGVVPLKKNADEAIALTKTIEKVLVVRRTKQDVPVARGRRSPEARMPRRVCRKRAHALSALHVRDHREAQRHRAHVSGVPRRRRDDAQAHLRREGRRRVLVRRRHRLGHRSQLHRLRTARERNDRRHVRRHTGFPRQRPLVVDHREVQGLDPLLRPHGDPHVHEVGRRVSRQARHVLVAPARIRRRADQP